MTPFWAEDGSCKQRLSMTRRRIHYQWKAGDDDSLLIYTHKWWAKKPYHLIPKKRMKESNDWNPMRKESYG